MMKYLGLLLHLDILKNIGLSKQVVYAQSKLLVIRSTIFQCLKVYYVNYSKAKVEIEDFIEWLD